MTATTVGAEPRTLLGARSPEHAEIIREALTMARSTPGAFCQPLDRISALYFAVTIFSTVGLGDIVPRSDPARIVVTIQMVADLIVIAVVVRLIFGAAARGSAARSVETEAGRPD